MYRDTLVKIKGHNKCNYLKSMWAMEIPGLVRVPFFDKQDKKNAYVVYYSEVEQTYALIKFEVETGKKIWTSRIVNGGYGTAVVWDDLVIVLKGFCGLAAFDKSNGNLVWEFETNSRVRSSLNIIDDMLVFSSAGNIYMLDKTGNVIKNIKVSNTFFFGTISKHQNHIIAIGTRFNEKTQSSNLYLFGIKDDYCIYEVDLGKSHVISSDTAGFVLENNEIIINCYNRIYKINADNGEILWKKEVEGNCGRHISVTDGENVYYTTINGFYGVLDYSDGTKIWSKKVNEGCIVAPISVVDDNIFVLADSYLINLYKKTGEIVQMLSIGHAPYSACVIRDNYLFVGGGEPPVNGLLRAFLLNNHSVKNELQGHYEFGNFIENEEMEINIVVDNDVEKLVMDASEISTVDRIEGEKIGGMINFKVPLKKNIVGGYYSIPILYDNSIDKVVDSISVYMFTQRVLPSRHMIAKFNKEIKQEGIFNSGSAIYELIMGEYGKEMSQKEFRKIIDYVKKKSKWQDADFQTWRLILKRVLSSPAKTLDEFIQLEKIYESSIKE